MTFVKSMIVRLQCVVWVHDSEGYRCKFVMSPYNICRYHVKYNPLWVVVIEKFKDERELSNETHLI